jgi:hypothetical protein
LKYVWGVLAKLYIQMANSRFASFSVTGSTFSGWSRTASGQKGTVRADYAPAIAIDNMYASVATLKSPYYQGYGWSAPLNQPLWFPCGTTSPSLYINVDYVIDPANSGYAVRKPRVL